MRKPKKLSMCFFEPNWVKNKNKGAEVYKDHPLTYGDTVIFLGEIPNSIGHCVVVKDNGKCLWCLHTSDFREATEEEV